MRVLTTLLATGSLVAGLAAASLGSASSAQAVSCTPMDGGQQYLTRWGDYDTYVVAPGGSFSSTTSPWRLYGARVTTTDGNPYQTVDTQPGALVVDPGGQATSTSMCVKWEDDRLRFFYKAPYGSSLKVTTQVSSYYGTYSYSTWVTSWSNSWQLSPIITIPDGTDWDGTQYLKVTISNPGYSSIKVDDLLIDPWKYTRW